MNSFFVYMLRCADDSFYTGHTDDLEKRMSEHQNQQIPCYTSLRLPVELIYHAPFKTRDEAIAAERKIKGWSREKKKALINNDFRYIKLLSERRKK
jgi:Predicted endonuclease containing a URI domain